MSFDLALGERSLVSEETDRTSALAPETWRSVSTRWVAMGEDKEERSVQGKWGTTHETTGGRGRTVEVGYGRWGEVLDGWRVHPDPTPSVPPLLWTTILFVCLDEGLRCRVLTECKEKGPDSQRVVDGLKRENITPKILGEVICVY